MTTLAFLVELARLHGLATKGEWENSSGFVRARPGGETMHAPGLTVTTECSWVAECRDGEAFRNPEGNANFIAAVHNAFPRLLELAQAGVRAERYREALEFYAEPVWSVDGSFPKAARENPRRPDCGDRARAALKDADHG